MTTVQPTLPNESERAYFAMFEFLEAAWKRGSGITVADLLSGMSFFPNGGMMDPAYVSDWAEAWEKSKGKTESDYRISLNK